jgi:hypothetical protein
MFVSVDGMALLGTPTSLSRVLVTLNLKEVGCGETMHVLSLQGIQRDILILRGPGPMLETIREPRVQMPATLPPASEIRGTNTNVYMPDVWLLVPAMQRYQ